MGEPNPRVGKAGRSSIGRRSSRRSTRACIATSTRRSCPTRCLDDVEKPVRGADRQLHGQLLVPRGQRHARHGRFRRSAREGRLDSRHAPAARRRVHGHVAFRPALEAFCQRARRGRQLHHRLHAPPATGTTTWTEPWSRFYGKLAQGFTRDTFVGGEGTSLDPLDKYGRPMYLPPCTAGNAFFLWTLRHLMVQDWDTDDDGAPDTLRLLYAVPRRWLRDGAAIKFHEAPTAFGKLSLETESKLSQGELLVRIALPPHRPKKTLLRARVPEGWKAVSATVGDTPLSVDPGGVVDLSEQAGRITVRFQCAQTSRSQVGRLCGGVEFRRGMRTANGVSLSCLRLMTPGGRAVRGRVGPIEAAGGRHASPPGPARRTAGVSAVKGGPTRPGAFPRPGGGKSAENLGAGRRAWFNMRRYGKIGGLPPRVKLPCTLRAGLHPLPGGVGAFAQSGRILDTSGGR